jgi:hypothetical protein
VNLVALTRARDYWVEGDGGVRRGNTGVGNVGILFRGSFGELEVLLRNDLVERVLDAAEAFARIAMAAIGHHTVS